MAHAQSGDHVISNAIEQRDTVALRRLSEAPNLTEQQRMALRLLADLIEFAGKKKSAQV